MYKLKPRACSHPPLARGAPALHWGFSAPFQPQRVSPPSFKSEREREIKFRSAELSESTVSPPAACTPLAPPHAQAGEQPRRGCCAYCSDEREAGGDADGHAAALGDLHHAHLPARALHHALHAHRHRVALRARRGEVGARGRARVRRGRLALRGARLLRPHALRHLLAPRGRSPAEHLLFGGLVRALEAREV
eukprot:3419149-Rhodomonas_salina.3